MNSNNFSNFNNDKSQKTTDQLLKILQNSNDINSYLTDNNSNISNISFHEYLTQLLDEKGLTKAQVITDSNIQKKLRLPNLWWFKNTIPRQSYCPCTCNAADFGWSQPPTSPFKQWHTLSENQKRQHYYIWSWK